MTTSSVPRGVLVTRPTEFEGLLARHGTRDQARFFLETRGRSIESVESRHSAFEQARHQVAGAIPPSWRRSHVDRADLDRFLFEPADIVLALGQDGLVANVSKYLSGQIVIGLNPDPERNDGILVRYPPTAVGELLKVAVSGNIKIEQRTMVEARLDDGQQLLALNEVFIGHQSHQSARYVISANGVTERHSSSGLIVATGTGCTGWARSIALERKCALDMPAPPDARLIFFVREAFPTLATQTELTEGVISGEETVSIVSEIEDGGVIFGDGIESDRLFFPWGARATIGIAPKYLNLLVV